MLKQDISRSEKMIDAILRESGFTEATQELIKTIFNRQQEIIIALNDIVRKNGYQQKYNEKRLNELLEKVDPEEAEKRKRNDWQSGGVEHE